MHNTTKGAATMGHIDRVLEPHAGTGLARPERLTAGQGVIVLTCVDRPHGSLRSSVEQLETSDGSRRWWQPHSGQLSVGYQVFTV
jgi:hypothetical protein